MLGFEMVSQKRGAAPADFAGYGYGRHGFWHWRGKRLLGEDLTPDRPEFGG